MEDDSINHSTYVVRLPTTAISLDHRDLKSCFADLTSLIKLTNQVWEHIAVRLTWSLLRLIHLSPPKDAFPGFWGVFSFKFQVFSWPGDIFLVAVGTRCTVSIPNFDTYLTTEDHNALIKVMMFHRWSWVQSGKWWIWSEI